jgi:hypothetical protein
MLRIKKGFVDAVGAKMHDIATIRLGRRIFFVERFSTNFTNIGALHCFGDEDSKKEK